MMEEKEVISFHRPGFVSKLYVTNLPHDISEEELHELTSTFGLVYQINLKSSFQNDFNECMGPLVPSYAYVHYYSRIAAAKFRDKFHMKLLRNNYTIQVRFAKAEEDNLLPLTFDKCIELADYYLSCFGWSCGIVQVKKLSQVVCGQDFEVEMRCDSFIFVNNIRSPGLNVSKFKSCCLEIAIKQARASAITKSYKDAFRRISFICQGPNIVPTIEENEQENFNH